MKHRVAFLPPVLLAGILLAGCDTTPATGGAGPAAPPPPPGAPPPPPPPPVAASAEASGSGQPPLPPETRVGVFAGGVDDLAARATETASPPAATSEPATERVKAQAGVGAKGRSLDAYQGGLLVTPAKAYFAARERIVFDVQFPSQYKIYKAMDGQTPKDFEELKANVLDPYQIKLPPLPPGHRYVWDPESEELQVERPRPQ